MGECAHEWLEIYRHPIDVKDYRLSHWKGDDATTSTLPQWCRKCGTLYIGGVFRKPTPTQEQQ